MKSIYKRQLVMMISIVAVSFTLLSAAFMLLSYRYILSEKRQALERNAEDIASLTSRYISSAWGGDIQGEAFRNSLYLIVRSSDSYVVLSDAAGAMIYVTVDELIPDCHIERRSNHGTLGTMLGFLVMMLLDVALG